MSGEGWVGAQIGSEFTRGSRGLAFADKTDLTLEAPLVHLTVTTMNCWTSKLCVSSSKQTSAYQAASHGLLSEMALPRPPDSHALRPTQLSGPRGL